MRAATLRLFSSSTYIWRGNPQATTKKTQEITQGITIKRGRPTKIEELDDKNIDQIVAGIRHSAVISKDGDMYTFGNGNYGVLGHGDEKNIPYKSPKLLDFFKDQDIRIKQAALGEFHTLALTTQGSVFSWGEGGRTNSIFQFLQPKVGALGHGDYTNHYSPFKIKWFEDNNIKIEKVATGCYHSVALDTQGKLYCWGTGTYGILGDGRNTKSTLPILNIALTTYAEEDPDNRIVDISAADQFTAVLTKKGEVFVWGKNDRGQLGIDTGVGYDMIESESLPKEIDFEKPRKIVHVETGQNSMLLVDDQGTIYRTGLKLDYKPRNTRQQFKELYESKVKVMGCGTKHYAYVNENGQIITWGNVLSGLEKLDTGHQIGNVQTVFDAENKRIKQLSLKYGTYLALLEDI